jgi:type VI secretion system secreted protein Hcp
MAAEFFLEIITKKAGKIKGETLSQACPEQIEVSKFTIGLVSPTDYDGGATGRIQLEHAEFEFPTSTATAPLFAALCTNDVIKSAILTCRKTGVHGKDATYLQWLFADARLVSFKMTGVDKLTVDSIKIAYSVIEVSYRPQKADGSMSTNAFQSAYSANDNAMSTPHLK